MLSGVGIELLGLITYLLSKPIETRAVTYQQLPVLHQQAF
jgi:hypothetical protein